MLRQKKPCVKGSIELTTGCSRPSTTAQRFLTGRESSGRFGSSPQVNLRLASLGMMKGKAFQPDERMKRILIDAVAIGSVTARALTARPKSERFYLYPGVESGRIPISMATTIFFTKEQRCSILASACTSTPRESPLPCP